MHVTIEHRTSRIGLITKRTFYEVRLKVDFTEDERHIINDASGLTNHVLLKRDKPAVEVEGLSPEDYDMRVSRLLGTKQELYVLASQLEANKYAKRLEAAMHELKAIINHNKAYDFVPQPMKTLDL